MSVKPYVVFALEELLKVGASKGSVYMNTHQFARMLHISQQGASRRLVELEKLGLIERRVSRRGQMIKLTAPAIGLLRQRYNELRAIFEVPNGRSVFFEGIAFKGLGEGRYYMSLDGYRKQFMEKLGFDLFPGTLNLRLTSPHELEERRKLEDERGILIAGFANGVRTYSSVKVLRAKVNQSVDGAVLLIERTHYGKDVLEVVAPIDLRKRFKIKDGDRVNVEVFS